MHASLPGLSFAVGGVHARQTPPTGSKSTSHTHSAMEALAGSSVVVLPTHCTHGASPVPALKLPTAHAVHVLFAFLE